MRYAVLGSSILLLLTAHAAAAVPVGFTETTYTSNALAPATAAAWSPDGSGRLFLLRKSGEIRVARSVAGALETQANALVSSVFATEPAVYTNSEGGLLGIAFDPNYQVNRYVYVFVSVSASQQQIVRYTDVDGGPDAAGTGVGRTVVLGNLPTAGQANVGGALAFGADGKLYFSIGELGNGTGVNADLTSLASKIGRANVDGTPANDNPFNDGVGPNNEYIWARGFRNPFGLVRQPDNGRLWVNVSGTAYEQVFAPARGEHAGFSTYENNQPANYLLPSIVYRTNGVDTRNVTAATRAAGTLTVTTPGAHGFRRGQRITLAGLADASFNGAVFVQSTPSLTSFTAAQAGPDTATSGGTAETQELGGSITRGDFYDATAFPAEYRGNYFFGDFNSGNLVRAEVTGTTVDRITGWGSGFSSNVQITTGPDGALYALGYSSGAIRRVTVSAPAPALIVSKTNPYVPEGGRAAFAVSLATAPAANVIVNVARSSGDADLGVSIGGALTFTPANWQQPQPVVLGAAVDVDAIVDEADFDVSAAGFGTERVHARSIEVAGARLVLSSDSLNVPEGGQASVTVAWSAPLSSNAVVTVTRTAGDTDVTALEPLTLSFTPGNAQTPQTVTFAAAQDDDMIAGRATFAIATALGAQALEVIEIDDEAPVEPDAGSDAGDAAVPDDAATPDDAGTEPDATQSSSSSSSSGGSSSSGAPPSSSSSSGAAQPPTPDGDASQDEDPAGGGCSTHASAGSSALWLGFGLLALRRGARRRRHPGS